jgi:hypothetical protein
MAFRNLPSFVFVLSGFALPLAACSASSPGSTDGGAGADATGGSLTGTGGAVLGSGGATGGASSGGTGSGTGGTVVGADPCETATICDDFEDGIDPAWGVQPDSNPAPVTDTTKGAKGSTTSLKITGTSNQAFITLPVPSQSFYVRAYVNFEKSTDEMTGHGWFIVGADNVTSGAGNQMRMGSSGNHGDGNQLDFNVYGNTCTGEKTQFSNGASDGAAGWNNTPYAQVKFDHDTWYCVEAFFNGTGDEFQYWIDGVEVPGLHVTEATMCTNWSPTYTHIKFGAGANSNLGNIWYDDVAVSTTRIGCPAQ